MEDRPDLLRWSERVRLEELTAAWRADAVITHSTAEAAVLARHMPAAKVHVVPWHVPLSPTAVPLAERQGFAFIGGYGHGPNVDAALWLVDRVVPAVAQQGTAIPCLLDESDMPNRPVISSAPASSPSATCRRSPPYSTACASPSRRSLAARQSFVDGLQNAAAQVEVQRSRHRAWPPRQTNPESRHCDKRYHHELNGKESALAQVAATPANLDARIRDLHEDAALNKACSDAGSAYVAGRLREIDVDDRLRAACDLPRDAGRAPKAMKVTICASRVPSNVFVPAHWTKRPLSVSLHIIASDRNGSKAA